MGRAATHALIQKQLRNIGGRLGNGGSAVTEAANAAARLRALPADTIVEPHVLAGFQTLFDRVDHRIADTVEDGIDRGAFVERIKVPQVGANAKSLIYPEEEKFVPVSRPSDLELVRTLREQLRPPPVSATPASPAEVAQSSTPGCCTDLELARSCLTRHTSEGRHRPRELCDRRTRPGSRVGEPGTPCLRHQRQDPMRRFMRRSVRNLNESRWTRMRDADLELLSDLR